ncbi:L-rhamnose 1-epimerase [Leucobacter sp. UCD-THU]|uniref:L-rhamnose mutarotase n=1 Tax=Leucobacter muris TaxID=1935379 RepID=A0ABX5QIZ3_9MICO|nr:MULTISPECIES: L-rhamnose mutarotase [Leucobacter]EYT54554.1 L-rhamnose 1-epimerase [Leucobacter sp. UCD-THU]QAB18928.1 L-rhamnose mutarotase [Leucobacter muris]
MRVCFQMQLRPELLAEYTARHAEVWPEMLEAVEDAGRRNYSLFLRADGLLIGYYETDDDERAQRLLAADPRTADWEEQMSRFFLASDGRPDQEAPRLTEVFHLEDQLARHRASTPRAERKTDRERRS